VYGHTNACSTRACIICIYSEGPAKNKQTANQTICQRQQLIPAAFGAAADRYEINSSALLAFGLRRCTEASEASVICTLEVRAPQANKHKTSTNKSRAKQAQAQAKDKCRRRQIQAPQAAKPNTRRFGAQKPTGQCGEKIEPCFCEGRLTTYICSLPKNEGVRLLQSPHLWRPRGICGAKPPAGVARAAGGMLPAVYCLWRASSARREGAARAFSGEQPAWGVPGCHQGFVGPQNYPCFLGRKIMGRSAPSFSGGF
jgi:hypothetical protein